MSKTARLAVLVGRTVGSLASRKAILSRDSAAARAGRLAASGGRTYLLL